MYGSPSLFPRPGIRCDCSRSNESPRLPNIELIDDIAHGVEAAGMVGQGWWLAGMVAVLVEGRTAVVRIDRIHPVVAEEHNIPYYPHTAFPPDQPASTGSPLGHTPAVPLHGHTPLAAPAAGTPLEHYCCYYYCY